MSNHPNPYTAPHRQHAATAVTGEEIEVQADSICIHGDTPGAVEMAAALRRGLEAAGVSIARMGGVV